MDEQEFRDTLVKWDQESIEERVQRWKQLGLAAYQGTLPSLVWEYLIEAKDMYIRGHPLGTILLCGAIVEMVLVHQIVLGTGMSEKEIERFTLEQKTILSRRLDILEAGEVTHVDELRKLRNALIHADPGKLAKGAKFPASVDARVSLYLTASWKDGITKDALKYLQATRELTLKFYGVKE